MTAGRRTRVSIGVVKNKNKKKDLEARSSGTAGCSLLDKSPLEARLVKLEAESIAPSKARATQEINPLSQEIRTRKDTQLGPT